MDFGFRNKGGTPSYHPKIDNLSIEIFEVLGIPRFQKAPPQSMVVDSLAGARDGALFDVDGGGEDCLFCEKLSSGCSTVVAKL